MARLQCLRGPAWPVVSAATIAVCTTTTLTIAQSIPPDPILERIKREAVERSDLAENIFQLTDAVGPRVVGSPAIRQAETWLAERLREYGLQNVRIEPNPPVNVGGGLVLDPPGWSWDRLTVQQLTPWQQTLIAVPVLYSPSTRGAVTGEVLVAPLPEPSESELASFTKRHRGQLRGKFLLLHSKESPIAPSDDPAFHRYTPEELKAMATFVPAPPTVAPAAAPGSSNQPQRKAPSIAEVFDRYSKLFEFLREEGV